MSRRRRSSEGRVLRFVRRLPTRPAALDPLREVDRPDASFEAKWRDAIRRRSLVVLFVLGGWVVCVEARLVHLQVFQHSVMLVRALKEQEKVISPVGVRGDIDDRNGEPLAMSVPAMSIIATPKDIKDPAMREMTVSALCHVFADCSSSDRVDLLQQLSTSRGYAYLRGPASVSPGQEEQLERLKLTGIGLIEDTQRYYPNFDLAAHVLGFVGKQNTGLGGIEYAYDGVIRGEPGIVRVERDAHGNGIQTRVDQPATTGATVELTIDQYLQHIAERELALGVEAHHALGGSVVIMDPNTGEILALANVPSFNPNAYEEVSEDTRQNRAVVDVYEPGSTFKIITVSAALQEGVWSLADTIDTSPGYLQIGARRIHDSEGQNNGVLSVEDVVVKSSNVGAAKIGLRVGAERLERYVQRFGFGQRLLPDLSGQSAGRVFGVADLNESALASMSFGYQISVTPLQMATAVSAVANGGTLYEPHLVRALIRNGAREPVAPKALRQVISPATAATMTGILEQVVMRGTGTKAALDGYTVAGKTGTAAKLVNGIYSQTAYNASFVGFVPSRHPVLTIVVVVDTPRGGSYFGGDVSAPIFNRIAEASLRQLRVLPTVASRASIVVTPPSPAPLLQPPSMLQPIVLRSADAAGPRMPDVRGLTPREAVRALEKVGLLVRLMGTTGVVTNQTPQAGDPIETGEWTSVQCGRVGTDTRLVVGGEVR